MHPIEIKCHHHQQQQGLQTANLKNVGLRFEDVRLTGCEDDSSRPYEDGLTI